jgi:hypothetical protein
MVRNRTRLVAIPAAVLIIGALGTWAWPRQAIAKPPLGLFTSLPIYWNESASVSDALDGDGEPQWARQMLEQHHRLVPLDALDPATLRPLNEVLMAQPRPLAPTENVALDDWVRAGGRLLLFADPFLTEHSRFPIGDKRRPQDVVLLSPILARWGLELTFDEKQDEAEHVMRLGAIELPVRLAGRLRKIAHEAPADCTVAADGLAAECRISAGRVTIVADAALLEGARSPAPALTALLDQAFRD